MSVLRAAALLVLGAVWACSGSREERPLPAAAPPEPTPSPSPAPGEQRLRGAPHVALDCLRGPIPARPGESPERSRTIEVEPAGVVHRTITRLDGTTARVVVDVDAAVLARIRATALASSDHAGLAPERPVPDGTSCDLRITDGTTQSWRVAWPTQQAPLEPLLALLVPLLYAE